MRFLSTNPGLEKLTFFIKNIIFVSSEILNNVTYFCKKNDFKNYIIDTLLLQNFDIVKMNLKLGDRDEIITFNGKASPERSPVRFGVFFKLIFRAMMLARVTFFFIRATVPQFLGHQVPM